LLTQAMELRASIRASQKSALAQRQTPEFKQKEHQLASVEEDLRTAGRRLEYLVESKRFCDTDKLRHESYIRDIEHYFHIPDYSRLYLDHNDFGRYFFKLSVGYEYTSINNILEESSPRIALLIFNYFDRRPYQEQYGLDYYGYQMFGNLILSGATEQKSGQTISTETEQVERTLGIDVGIFAPLLRHRIRPDLSHQFGLMAAGGAKQTDTSNKIRLRGYAGVRSAISPEHYIDALVGRSPGLKSVRMEFRGQMPVAEMGRGSRFFVGALANMGIANKKPNEDDVLTVYMSWNIDFLDLFTTGG
jgi:hypothetical protein